MALRRIRRILNRKRQKISPAAVPSTTSPSLLNNAKDLKSSTITSSGSLCSQIVDLKSQEAQPQRDSINNAQTTDIQEGGSSTHLNAVRLDDQQPDQPQVYDPKNETQSQPGDLWDRAYALLLEAEEGRKLMQAYQKILQAESINDFGVPTSVEHSHTANVMEIQSQMSTLISKGLQATEDAEWKLQLGKRTIKVREQIDRVIKVVLSANEVVTSTASSEPHAALAWAGVSLFLPLLLSPSVQSEHLLEGIDYISDLVHRFTIGQRFYNQQRPQTADPQLLGSYIYFEAQVVKLYSQILVYQARAICYHHKNTWMRYGRDVFKADDWATWLSATVTQEACCQKHLGQISAMDQNCHMQEVGNSFKVQSAVIEQVMKNIIDKVDHVRQDQEQWHRNKEEKSFLDALPTTNFEDDKNKSPERVEGTCKWFLTSQIYHRWLANPTSDLLWVTADPGCGKSVLSKSLIDLKLQSSNRRITNYFFFKDDSNEQRSAIYALSTLLYQICTQNKALLSIAVETHQRLGGKLTSSFFQLWSLLLTITQCSQAGELVCVLDALGECEELGRRLVIASLNELYSSATQSASNIKFLVTSRPYLEIEERFARSIIRMAGEAESEKIKEEIDLVIRDRIPRIAAQKKLDKRTQDTLEKRLLETENRTYLWLHLIMEGVEAKPGLNTPSLMASHIDRLPTTLFEVYESILNRSSERKRAEEVLHIIVAAERPLSLVEMNIALNIKEGQTSQKEIDLYPIEQFEAYLKDLCGLFIACHGRRRSVVLIHQTAKAFLVTTKKTLRCERRVQLPSTKWQNSMVSGQSQLMLAKKCMYYILLTEFDIGSLVWNEMKDFGISHNSRRSTWEWDQSHTPGKIAGFWDYAASYWAYDFQQSDEDDILAGMWLHVCDTSSGRFQIFVSKLLPDEKRDLAKIYAISRLIVAIRFGHHFMVKKILKGGNNAQYRHAYSVKLREIIGNEGAATPILKLLLDAGADVNIPYKSGMTPLHGLRFWNKLGVEVKAAIHLLIEAKADINARDHNDRTALDYLDIGCYQHAATIPSSLLEAGAIPDIQDESGRTFLHKLCREDDSNFKDAIKLLIRHGADVNRKDQHGETPLYYTENAIINAILLEAGADPNSINRRKTYSLHRACYSNHESAPVHLERLLQAGANPNMLDQHGHPLLYITVQREFPAEISSLLVDAEIDPRNHDEWDVEDPRTAHWDRTAAKCELLLQAGADPNVLDRHGRSALLVAIHRGFPAVICGLLLQAGADPNILDQHGHSLLHITAQRDLSGTKCELLIRNGADVGAHFTNSLTPLHFAATEGATKSVLSLIEAGADPNAQDSHRQAPLHVVLHRYRQHDLGLRDNRDQVWNDDRYIAAALLKAGADPNVIDNQCRKPLDIAIFNANFHIEDILKPHTSRSYYSTDVPQVWISCARTMLAWCLLPTKSFRKWRWYQVQELHILRAYYGFRDKPQVWILCVHICLDLILLPVRPLKRLRWYQLSAMGLYLCLCLFFSLFLSPRFLHQFCRISVVDEKEMKRIEYKRQREECKYERAERRLSTGIYKLSG